MFLDLSFEQTNDIRDTRTRCKSDYEKGDKLHSRLANRFMIACEHRPLAHTRIMLVNAGLRTSFLFCNSHIDCLALLAPGTIGVDTIFGARR
jgi:hypothetical protein